MEIAITKFSIAASPDNLPWGYMQMGRSLKVMIISLMKLILLLGLPIAMMLVGGSSWWLAGL